VSPTSANPLATPWPGPYGGVPPWDHLAPELFPDAFREALAEQRAEIETIADSTETPTFANTVEALERSGKARERVERLFEVARENVTNPEYQALEREWQPALAAATDAIFLNSRLFARLDAVRSSPDVERLAFDQRRLTMYLHDLFVRRGARLDPERKKTLARINQELASLYTDFRQKVMADEDTWTVLENDDDLAGLPASVVESARAAATERQLAGQWAIVNTRSSVDPFLTFSSRRDLRERVWRKFKSRGDNGDANDSKATIARMVKRRADRARLLGYPSHAHWRMADTMAKDPESAQALLMRVWQAAVARVRRDVADMQAVAAREGGPAAIEPWDYLYYAEKVRKAQYDLDQGDLKPYFEVNRMIAAALWTAEQRYDLAFDEITGTVPVFHQDVRVWEVKDGGSGAHRGLFYLDTFARPGKRSGAWMSSYRLQHTLDRPVTAITSNNNNFVKAAVGEPVLISLDDAKTLFHEFGHALHYLLQDIRYRTLAVTPRDFVELPSQVNENWVLTREVLDRFARHHETGGPLPQALVEKVERTRTFNQGYMTVETVSAALLDMDLHTRPDGDFDPSSFERDALAEIGMPREIALRHRLPHFDHLFGSDGYSAGYYSYVWADVMAADTWNAFLESGGPWDKETARRFRQHILSDGNVADRADAYRAFRGRDPDPGALLEHRGLSDPSRPD
jgi:peptidyl-dipeptidase Dcp